MGKIDRRNGRKAPISSARAIRRKIIIEFPESLLRETEQAVHEMAMNRSQLIRLAVEVFLRKRKQKELERELAESLVANSNVNRRLMDEFKHVDSEWDV